MTHSNKSPRLRAMHERTFAGTNALEPRIIKICVEPRISALLEPSTASSTTTELAGFLVRAALGTGKADCWYGDGGWGSDARRDERLCTCSKMGNAIPSVDIF